MGRPTQIWLGMPGPLSLHTRSLPSVGVIQVSILQSNRPARVSVKNKMPRACKGQAFHEALPNGICPTLWAIDHQFKKEKRVFQFLQPAKAPANLSDSSSVVSKRTSPRRLVLVTPKKHHATDTFFPLKTLYWKINANRLKVSKIYIYIKKIQMTHLSNACCFLWVMFFLEIQCDCDEDQATFIIHLVHLY